MSSLYQGIVSLCIAIVLYYLLDSISSKKKEAEQRTTLSKWITFGVIWTIVFVVVYYMNNMMSGGDDSLQEQISSIHKNYEVSMIKNITENVRTGFPPF